MASRTARIISPRNGMVAAHRHPSRRIFKHLWAILAFHQLDCGQHAEVRTSPTIR
jgi:hypothetical protein